MADLATADRAIVLALAAVATRMADVIGELHGAYHHASTLDDKSRMVLRAQAELKRFTADVDKAVAELDAAHIRSSNLPSARERLLAGAR